jgi:hypothetical protein
LFGQVTLDSEQVTEGADVTEQEWLACTDPRPMVGFLRSKASDRKVRLLAVACCRRVWATFTDARSRTAIVVAERFADGNATFSELDRARTDAGVAASESGWDDSREAAWATSFGLLLDNIIVEPILRVLECQRAPKLGHLEAPSK